MNDSETMMHYLEVLLKNSNFTKAAKELYISQPYLTQLIKRLEHKLGTQIINRDQIPFTLTESGQFYYQYLENISSQKHLLHQQIQRFSDKDNETIRIAVLESLGTFLLPQILPTFLEKHPKVKIQISEGFPHKSEERVLNNQVDCYMGQTPQTLAHGIDAYINGGEIYYIVIPSNSKFFQADKFILDPSTYTLQELLTQPYILSTPESAIRHQVNGLFQNYHLIPNIKMVTNSVITAANLAVNGVGFTISCASILKRLEQIPINLYPLDPNIIKITYFIGTKSNQRLSPALHDLIKTFQTIQLQEYIK